MNSKLRNKHNLIFKKQKKTHKKNFIEQEMNFLLLKYKSSGKNIEDKNL